MRNEGECELQCDVWKVTLCWKREQCVHEGVLRVWGCQGGPFEGSCVCDGVDSGLPYCIMYSGGEREL